MPWLCVAAAFCFRGGKRGRQTFQDLTLISAMLSCLSGAATGGRRWEEGMEEDFLVHRSLSDAAGKGATRLFDARLNLSLSQQDPPFIYAPFTFSLPRLLIEEDCACVPIDHAVDKVMRSLRLPCWKDVPLCPIRTDGDGDCLLHAVCIAIWGFHDRQVRLRSVLAEWVLSPRLAPVLKELFIKWESMEDGWIGAERSKEQLTEEWERHVVAHAVSSHEYLSRFHVFLLANIIRRPIIVLSDSYVRAQDGSIFSPLAMRGLYLPSLVPIKDRSHDPIVVAYTVLKGRQGHFTALVGVDQLEKAVPLQDENGDMFFAPYVVVHEDDHLDLHEYFDLSRRTHGGKTVACARLPSETLMCPEAYNIRESLLSEAAKELRDRARVLYRSAEEAERQARKEARLQQQETERLLNDVTVRSEQAILRAPDKEWLDDTETEERGTGSRSGSGMITSTPTASTTSSPSPPRSSTTSPVRKNTSGPIRIRIAGKAEGGSSNNSINHGFNSSIGGSRPPSSDQRWHPTHETSRLLSRRGGGGNIIGSLEDFVSS